MGLGLLERQLVAQAGQELVARLIYQVVREQEMLPASVLWELLGEDLLWEEQEAEAGIGERALQELVPVVVGAVVEIVVELEGLGRMDWLLFTIRR